MARRPGLKTMPISAIRGVLVRQRADQWDVYAPLSRMRIGVENSLSPDLFARYHLLVSDGARKWKLRLGPTSMRQLGALVGVSPPLLERLPVSHSVKTVRLMMQMMEGNDRPLLVRLKGTPEAPRLRAILPNSFVRFDDVELYRALLTALGRLPIKVVRFVVNEDLFHVRFVYGDALELATARSYTDPAFPGLDITSSETGCFPTEVRYVLFRVMCCNGMTQTAEAGGNRRFRKTGMDREVFRAVVRSALEEASIKGRYLAERLGDSRGHYLENPSDELARIFAHFRLGSTGGRLARWVASELVRSGSLVGVRRFDVINAFTATARGLEPAARVKLEDAMASYLVNGFGTGNG